MEKVFGVINDGDAHFYEMQIDNLEKIIIYLSKKLKYSVHDRALCNFYSHNAHDYGFYQNDINGGLCKVTNSKVIQRTKKTINDSEDIAGVGVVEFDLDYQSQIVKVIKDIFCSKIKFVDFSKLIKLSNYYSDVKQDLKNSENFMKREEIYLNDVEKAMSKEEFLEIIDMISKNISFKYIGTISKEDIDKESMGLMYKIAQRNTALNSNPNFKSIMDSVSDVVDVKMLKKQ